MSKWLMSILISVTYSPQSANNLVLWNIKLCSDICKTMDVIQYMVVSQGEEKLHCVVHTVKFPNWVMAQLWKSYPKHLYLSYTVLYQNSALVTQEYHIKRLCLLLVIWFRYVIIFIWRQLIYFYKYSLSCMNRIFGSHHCWRVISHLKY